MFNGGCRNRVKSIRGREKNNLVLVQIESNIIENRIGGNRIFLYIIVLNFKIPVNKTRPHRRFGQLIVLVRKTRKCSSILRWEVRRLGGRRRLHTAAWQSINGRCKRSMTCVETMVKDSTKGQQILFIVINFQLCSWFAFFLQLGNVWVWASEIFIFFTWKPLVDNDLER